MKVEVQLLNISGRKVPLEQRKASRKFSGNLAMGEERVPELGRTALVAKLLSVREKAPTPLLPALHDASVVHVEDGRLRIRGFEIVDAIQTGQTWDVTVLPC